MGSLPNLHELCNKEEGAQVLPPHTKGQLPSSANSGHEKSKSLYGRQTSVIATDHQKKSNGHATHVCDDLMLEVGEDIFVTKTYVLIHNYRCVLSTGW